MFSKGGRTMKTEAYVEKLMKDYNVAGMSVAVVKDGKVIHNAGYGRRNVAEDLPMSENTVLPIGSTTKSFTALALAMLVDEGKLEWDEPVITYIPWLRLATDELTKNVTTRDLLCHRTGIPRYDMQAAFYILDDWKKQTGTFKELKPNKAFRTAFQYSNQMVSLAGHLIDVLTEQSYEDFVRERIFRPLGMEHTDFEVDSLKNYEESSKGYVFDGKNWMEPPYLHLGALNPAGGIVSTSTDMANYMLFQLGDGTWNGTRLVSKKNLDEMHTHQMIGSPYFWTFPEEQTAEYGLAWMVDIYRGKKVVSHGGNTNGFSSQLALLPENGFGIVALSNATSSFSVEALSNYLLDEELGVAEIPDWSKRYQDVFTNYYGEIMKGIQDSAAKKIPDTKTTKELSAYAGTYENPGFGTLEITFADGKLSGSWNGFPAMLNHYHYDGFDILLPLMGAQLPAQFVIGDDGAVAGVKVGVETAPGTEPDFFRKTK